MLLQLTVSHGFPQGCAVLAGLYMGSGPPATLPKAFWGRSGSDLKNTRF